MSDTQPTVPLPPVVERVETGQPASVVERVETGEPAPVVERVETKPTRKKRRWLPWLIALVVLLILLVVAFFVGDAFARQYATGYVRERIVEALDLDPATPIDVDLGTGSILLQAASGSINEVHVGIDNVAFGDVSGSAQLVATGVPVSGEQPVDTLGIEVTIDEENVQKLAGSLSELDLKSIRLGDGLITVSTDLNVVIFTLPVTVGLQPSASEGGISFEPETLTLNDQAISVEDLRNNPVVGGLASQLLASQDFCVASYLPKAFTISDVDVVGSNLVVKVNGDGAVLSGSDLTSKGTCP